MNEDERWDAIDAHRLRTAAMLEQLTDAEWNQASLCEGWTVRDVAAHLTQQQSGLGDVLRMLRKYRGGGLNRMIRESVREKAVEPVDRLIAQIRGMVGSRRHNLGLTSGETLIDIVVHSQDIAVPLDRELPVPPEAAAEAASRVFPSLKKRVGSVFRPVPWRGLRFTATDVDWSAGEGPEVRGPMLAILMFLTGRRIALDELHGEGAAVLQKSLERGGRHAATRKPLDEAT